MPIIHVFWVCNGLVNCVTRKSFPIPSVHSYFIVVIVHTYMRNFRTRNIYSFWFQGYVKNFNTNLGFLFPYIGVRIYINLNISSIRYKRSPFSFNLPHSNIKSNLSLSKVWIIETPYPTSGQIGTHPWCHIHMHSRVLWIIMPLETYMLLECIHTYIKVIEHACLLISAFHLN